MLLRMSVPALRKFFEGTVPPRGVGTVLVAACPMLHLKNTVSGRRLFHKQSTEFCIECHTVMILDGRIEFIGRVFQ